MASGGHMLLYQKPGVEARIKTLINNDLKEICKTYGAPVSGTKIVLQKRCIEILDKFVRTADKASFDEFSYRVNHHGAPSGTHRPHSQLQGGAHHSSTMGSNGTRPMSAARLPANGRYFKISPFYEIVETVLPLQDIPDGPEMPQNRNTVRTSLKLTEAVVQQLKSDPSMRLLIYCGLTQGMSLHSPVDVQFPNQLEVKINDDDIRHNFKGLKNKVGTTKPADITGKTRLAPGYNNQITFTYALTTKRYAYTVHLARHVSSDILVNRIKIGNVIPRQQVLDDMSKANADPDIAATAIRMSLKDPVSTMRITLPVRSTVCSHNQCFDCSMFLLMQEQAPQWQCPVCSKNVNFLSLCVDKYFEDILERTPAGIDKVDIEPNGEWKVIKEEEDAPTNGTSKQLRAAYDKDDDDDDDLIEITELPGTNLNGIRPPSQRPLNQPSPALSSRPSPVFTPNLFSREPSAAQSTSMAPPPQSNKRSADAVIDLTLSDDDEPPRPAKRTATALPPMAGTAPLQYSNPRSRPPSFGQVEAPRSFAGMTRPPSVTSNGGFGFQRTESPQSPMMRPNQPIFGNYGFSQQHARHTSSGTPSGTSNNAGVPPFQYRPPSAQSGPLHGVNSPLQSGPRLPPIQPPIQPPAQLLQQQRQQQSEQQPEQQRQSNGESSPLGPWRSETTNYSSSPPG